MHKTSEWAFYIKRNAVPNVCFDAFHATRQKGSKRVKAKTVQYFLVKLWTFIAQSLIIILAHSQKLTKDIKTILAGLLITIFALSPSSLDACCPTCPGFYEYWFFHNRASCSFVPVIPMVMFHSSETCFSAP